MHRPKRDLKRELPNPELTPKVPAKRPMNINRKAIGGQQSAQHGNRRPIRQLTALKESTLTEKEIESSAMIRMLEQQIRIMGHRHQVQMSKLRQVKAEREKQLELVQREQYNTKLQIWELKNQALELKESIREEKEEGQRLTSELQEDEREQVE